MAALRPQNLPPGQYNFPHAGSAAALKDERIRLKFAEGPVGYMTVAAKGLPSMGKSMILSLAFYLLVGIVIAYLASRTLSPGADYSSVFRVVSTTAWLTYGAGVVPEAIWFGRPWSGVAKHLFDALIYALLTAGVFGWLWPNV